MDDNRPNPDELLANLFDEERKEQLGKLKIFFGMCAGVGKTYSMLKAAKEDLNKGKDVVIGYVETHNRIETEELTIGFETIPRKTIMYRSTAQQEMDLDAIIARKPQIVLVDELAHSNVPGSRHSKRYHDIRELLENGISVYTTLNVQHLESRSDTVAQITGVVIRETVPDSVFENAQEVEVVDLTPVELLQRLSEGKVYTPEQSSHAIENFFKKGNITALREMALRLVADRVDKQLHEYLHAKKIQGPWKSGLHLLVAMDYSQTSTRLLRWAKNLSYSMGAGIQALYVETNHKLTTKESEQLEKNINLAKQLGIGLRIITADDVVRAIVNFAHKENITHIVVGKPRNRDLFAMVRLGSFVHRLIRYSGNIDVYILGADKHAKDKYKNTASLPSFTSTLSQYFSVVVMVGLLSLGLFVIKSYIGYQVVSFVLLFLVSILALFYGTGPILVAATLSALGWNFFFIPPAFTLHISKPEDALMFVMFFIIALVNGILTSRIRRQEKKTRVREERTHALYQLSRELSQVSGIDEVTKLAKRYILNYFQSNCALLLKSSKGSPELTGNNSATFPLTEQELSIASWVFKHAAKAGKYTDTLPSTPYTFYPLSGSSETMGVIAVELKKQFTQGEDLFWEAFMSQISGKIEREVLREAARKAFVLSESDKLYKTLFNSISHELRIPVATIMGAADTLTTVDYPRHIQHQLYNEISTASVRLNRLIENLLNMSRLESGRIQAHPDWCDINDLANAVAANLAQELKPFRFTRAIPSNMPLVFVDFGLTEQILHNLLLNATQYSQPGTSIRLKFFIDGDAVVMQVMDRGRGFAFQELDSLFNKFFRGNNAKTGGTGLGLSIVKGFAEAQGGTVSAINRTNGGALFTVKLPTQNADIKQFSKTNE